MNPSQALLHFASNSSSGEEELCFDGADVSPASLELLRHDRSDTSGQVPEGVLDLSGRMLRKVSLRDANLCEVNFSNADLSGASAGGVLLRAAFLEGANLQSADLVGADLSQAHAGEANFTQALLEDANLVGAQLRFTDFSEATLDGVDLTGADLWGAKFRSTIAERIVFRNARMDESSLVEGEFAGADFSGATLRRADLAMCQLQNANFRDAVLDGANLAGANLKGALLPNLPLTSCNLHRASFSGAWLERTRMHARQIGDVVGEEAAGDLEGALDSYIVLERNFTSLGNSQDAGWAYLQRRNIGRQLYAKTARRAYQEKQWVAALQATALWTGDTASAWLCNYGESLYRVARAFITILLSFALIYWLSGALTARSGSPDGSHSAWINYLLFSLDSMTTVGTSEIALRPKGELGVLLSSIQTVLGTVLLGLFGFVLGARIRN